MSPFQRFCECSICGEIASVNQTGEEFDPEEFICDKCLCLILEKTLLKQAEGRITEI